MGEIIEQGDRSVYQPPFTMISNDLIRCEHMSPTLKTIYSIICCFANGSGSCFPSYGTIAAKAGVSRSTVIRSIKTLEESGLLVKEYRKNGSEYSSNTYTIRWWNPQAEAYFKDRQRAAPSVVMTPPSSSVTPPPSVNMTPPSVTDTPNQYPDNNNHLSNNNQSINRQPKPAKRAKAQQEARQSCKGAIKEQIEYDVLLQSASIDAKLLDNIVAIMTDMIHYRPQLNIGGQTLPGEAVAERYREINSAHIEYVLACMAKTSDKIRNIRNYLITALYNAPATMDSYYQAEVNADRC